MKILELHDISNAISTSKATRAAVEPVLKAVTAAPTFMFWDRFLENTDAALLLIRSGYINEANTIHRLSIENFAYAVALLQGKLTEQQLLEEMEAELPEQAQKLYRSDQHHPTLTPENRGKLEHFMDEASSRNARKTGINTYNALGACRLDFLYTRYRLLSVRAAHATLLSAIRIGTPTDVEELLSGMRDLLALIDAFAKDAATRVGDSCERTTG